MTTSLHARLTTLKSELKTIEGEGVYDLCTAAIGHMPVSGNGKIMRLSALEALQNVIDVACNSGTVENLFELEQALENSAGFEIELSNEESEKILPELFNFSYQPDAIYATDEPLQDVINAWCVEVGAAAHSAIVGWAEAQCEEIEAEQIEDEESADGEVWLCVDCTTKALSLGNEAVQVLRLGDTCDGCGHWVECDHTMFYTPLKNS